MKRSIITMIALMCFAIGAQAQYDDYYSIINGTKYRPGVKKMVEKGAYVDAYYMLQIIKSEGYSMPNPPTDYNKYLKLTTEKVTDQVVEDLIPYDKDTKPIVEMAARLGYKPAKDYLNPPGSYTGGGSSTASKETITVNGVSFNMIRVDGGSFSFGSSNVSKSVDTFYMGETEVTQELWYAVMGTNPSHFRSDRNPVELVSYYDCLDFISKLNSKTGRQFRLPTEVEWEYAAKGGKQSKGYKYSGSNVLNSVSWNSGNANSSTHNVKMRAANELGFYDMTGNVWEWTSTIGDNDNGKHTVRGGSFSEDEIEKYQVVTFSGYYTNDKKNTNCGFRLAMLGSGSTGGSTTGLTGSKQTVTANGVQFTMIRVNGGSYQMGSERTDSEKPIHRVSVNDFYIGETEVTQELWKAVMGTNPAKMYGLTRPVENITYSDCETFVNKLSTLTGINFRIPTEEEWEYAARGGSRSYGYKFAGSNDYSSVAWVTANSNSSTHNVKLKSPNELGIYDMSGNVQEWVNSGWSENYNASRDNSQRVVRGGAYDLTDWAAHTTYRYGFSKSTNLGRTGLRIAAAPGGGNSNNYGNNNNSSASKRYFTANGVQFTMIRVNGGSFQMGSERTNDEKPVHRVSVNDFYIGETEVTQELWRAVMGTNPSKRLGTQRPVESISFNDCETFVNKLNTLTGMNFRIPTEEEWEFAARGGTSSRGYKFAGSDDCNTVSWNSSNSNEDTHNVKMRSPNELGIYDMSGNVQEWVYSYWSDGYNGSKDTSKRIVRGGSFDLSNWASHCTYRYGFSPGTTIARTGLRIAL